MSRTPDASRSNETADAGSAIQAQTGLAGIIWLLIFVAGTAWIAHAPVLDAQALAFDDGRHLEQNPAIGDPGLDSAIRFFAEVFAPQTQPGYDQPLTLRSLMLDRFGGG